jgi:hypothetical protein
MSKASCYRDVDRVDSVGVDRHRSLTTVLPDPYVGRTTWEAGGNGLTGMLCYLRPQNAKRGAQKLQLDRLSKQNLAVPVL